MCGRAEGQAKCDLRRGLGARQLSHGVERGRPGALGGDRHGRVRQFVGRGGLCALRHGRADLHEHGRKLQLGSRRDLRRVNGPVPHNWPHLNAAGSNAIKLDLCNLVACEPAL